MKMWRPNFRQKIIIGFTLLCCVFVLIIFPFIGKIFRTIVYDGLKKQSDLLVSQLQEASSQEDMIEQLKQIHEYVFFRASLFDDQGQLLYDSAITDEKQLRLFSLHRADVTKTLQKGFLYTTGQSVIYKELLIYVILAFQHNDSVYILRTALPYEPIEILSLEVRNEFLLFCFFTLLFFGCCLWLIFHRMNFPIKEMIRVIEPYQSGKEEFIAPINLPKSIDKRDKFYQLAETLNSLSERIRTQIRHIVEERDEKEAILESLGEGVIAVDADMLIRYVNYIGGRMIGFSRKQLIGKPFSEIIAQSTGPLLEKCRQLLETCQKKTTILTDSIYIADGKKMYLDLIAAPKPHKNGAILVLQDKSSHYKVLEMGKDFVANASHELRTPITIIRGFAETLHDLPELPKEMVSDITEKIVRNCQRMDNLVKNLLTLADLENLPESRFQECDLVALLENCKQVVLSIYQDAQITIEKTKEAITVDADPDILELAIINLMDNSAKYSLPPARITIKIDEIGDEAHITIADKGIGIPAEDIEHVFERFYTVNKAHSRRLGGAGLGLSIVKTIIDKHHGSIAVSSVLRQGTTFTIVLPIHRTSIY